MNFKESAKSTTAQIVLDAEKYIAGGVVSLNRKVDPNLVFVRGKGSRIYDAEGKEYIDYHAAFAPHLLGHNDSRVNEAVVRVMRDEHSLFGSGTNALEVKLSRLLCEAVPSLDLVQITNTGSEATAHAIRLSRAWTKRDDIILTLGGYNGWHNDVSRAVMASLAQLGPRVSPGEYPFIPSSAGVPESTRRRVHIVNFNDLESIEYVMKRYPVACVLTEPVLQNVGIVLPKRGYLQGIIDLCIQYGAVSIFDEVKTGFRSALGGYQSLAGVKPHLSVFGKAVANGFPLGVIGGSKEIMGLFDAPDAENRVLIAGTYNAHPINAAAAIATLQILRDTDVYEHLDAVSNKLYSNLEKMFQEKGKTMVLARNASAFCLYFLDKPPVDLHDILLNHDFAFDLKFRKALIGKGIYHIPIACKQGSVSYAHSEEDIDKTLEITWGVLKKM
ncbi:MAG TPA: aspartate aminotransferase family protein [Chryseosolibacter sp.]|nr:aspartate aminotransferase family protein [Chryseosolibacter sp.]